MSKHLARDSAVWNRIMYGGLRSPSPVQLKSEKADHGAESDSDSDSVYELPVQPQQSRNRRFNAVLGVSVCLLFFWTFFRQLELGLGGDFAVSQFKGPSRYGGFVDTGSFASTAENAKEVLGVAFPLDPDAKYGAPVHSEVLVNHTFDSWGNPAFKEFVPPKEGFNHVVLTLTTSVDGVQYDRLAHLYVGGAEIWRTSTIEPGAHKVYSTFTKDVSPYAGLFQQRTPVLFQLDNVVNLRLTGKFHIELTAHFYRLARFHSEELATLVDSETVSDQYAVFDTRKPADKVVALVAKSSPSDPPLKYLPSLKFAVKLPQVPCNTTRLKLAAFVSGNADEEFWYSNVLDQYTDRFEKNGHRLYGHAPTRFLNVYVDGVKVAAQTPQPFIFTGGFSPALWNPVVPINAFDLPSMDIDVTGLLPLLWKSGDHELAITVDNGLDEVEGLCSGVGQNWIVSANLLAYENSNVARSSGKVVHIGDRARGHSFGVSPPYTGTLQQIVDGIFEGQLTSELVFEMSDGSVVNTTVNTFTKGEVSNVQLYSHKGSSVKIVHVGHSSKSFLVTDNLNDGSVVHQTNVSLSYPMVISLTETSVKNGLDLDFKIANSKVTTLDINGERIMEEADAQNGTSLFHIRPKGNVGSGALLTRFKAQIRGRKRKYHYKRNVDSADGQVLRDEEEYKDINEKEWKEFSREIKEMSEVHHEHRGCGRFKHGAEGKHHGKFHAKGHRKHHGRHHWRHHAKHHGKSEEEKEVTGVQSDYTEQMNQSMPMESMKMMDHSKQMDHVVHLAKSHSKQSQPEFSVWSLARRLAATFKQIVVGFSKAVKCH